MRQGLVPIGTVAAAVIVFVTALYVVIHNDAPAGTGATPGYQPSPVATLAGSPGPTPAALVSTTPTVSAVTRSTTAASTTSVPAPATVIAFLGDDWTAGAGADSPQHGFVPAVAAALHVTARPFAVAGGGYAHAAPNGTTYADLVAAVAAAAPNVVVVSGGRNDMGDYLPTLQTAATDLFAALHAKLPRASLVAVAPWWGDSDHPADLTAIAAAVKAAVTAVGGAYLDAPDPLHDHPDWMADASDPNAAGYAAVAASLTSQLKPLLTR